MSFFTVLPTEGGGGGGGGDCNCTWNNLPQRPTHFPSTIPLVANLEEELADLENGQHFPVNHFVSTDPPNDYPLGVSFTTVGGAASGFPFNGSIKTFRYEDGKAEQYGSTLTGQRWYRVGSSIAWQGASGGWRRLPDTPIQVLPSAQFNPNTANANTLYFLT